MEMITSMSQAFKHGGIWMWVIFIAQMFSVAIIAERVFALYINRKTDSRKFVKIVEEDIRRGNLDRAMTKAKNMGDKQPIAQVILAGTQAAQDMGGREEIQAKIDEVLLAENEILEKRTGFLAMIGNVGTLLGLLGTITGLIDSFAGVANVNPIEKAALLSAGISMAMHSTAYGLIMAIPALVMYAVLMNRSHTLAEDLNQAAFSVFNLLSFKYESVPARKVR